MQEIKSEENPSKQWGETKLKLFEVCQQVKYMPYPIEGLINRLEAIPHMDGYAWILHDKDKDVEPHYHVIIKLNNAYSVNYLCRQLEMPSNVIERVKTTFAKSLAYLIHQTPSARNKYQYSEGEVYSNVDFKALLIQSQKKQDASLRRDQLIADIQNGEVKRYELEQYFRERDIDPIYRTKWKKDIESAFSVWLENISSSNDRNMSVIYVYGPSGTGKTTFVKDYAEKRNKPLYNCSSNMNDLFSGYKQQPYAVIDDIQSGLPYSMVLKLLDNNTSSLYASRYYDKAINTIEVLFITSTMPIEQIFRYSTDFEMKQIRRCIGTVLYVSKEKVYVFKYSEEKDAYEKTGFFYNPTQDYIKRHENSGNVHLKVAEEILALYNYKEDIE